MRYGLIPAIIVLLLGSGCGNTVQTSSGEAYLAKAGGGTVTDGDIVRAASVEPALRFPARIGLARIERGRLTAIPAGEQPAWRELAVRLGPGYGEFVPVSPLIAAFASNAEPQTSFQRPEDAVRRVVGEIRQGAARQHVDAVLIYEVVDRTRAESNPLAITKLALIGFFLPSEDVEVDGVAEAVLMDVRNGYTYGTASSQTVAPLSAMTTSGNAWSTADRLRDEAHGAAVDRLAVEVEAMARRLREELPDTPRGALTQG